MPERGEEDSGAAIAPHRRARVGQAVWLFDTRFG
jgi:hypothetical protein